MRIRGLPILLSTLALGACQDLSQIPDDPSQPRATLSGTHVSDPDGDRVSTFRTLDIGGHPVNLIGVEPAKTFGVDATNDIAAGRHVQISFEGLLRYRNTGRSMFWSPMHVDGKIDFVPVANAHYVVTGQIDPKGSSVWIEDAATHQVIDHKFVGTPAMPASAAEYKFQAGGG